MRRNNRADSALNAALASLAIGLIAVTTLVWHFETRADDDSHATPSGPFSQVVDAMPPTRNQADPISRITHTP